MTTLNPYALEEARAADGIDVCDPRPAAEQTADQPLPPIIEGGNPAIHLAHGVCQRDVPSWCGIALDQHYQRTARACEAAGTPIEPNTFVEG
ncbi:hypothetical protein MK786_03890 [Microbacterium sp. CFH 31415]|uniref:hypothetical protein n=1 Tax=Microbacterium sp. CFH 31415 TaxID=2921732 RepID=UPI001F142438|nr:hypothetical protein [Microbacterium sp. CFH 31415]MCH6229876.1 hypothetical protein [Microbacterium sp. CFH 31415]